MKLCLDIKINYIIIEKKFLQIFIYSEINSHFNFSQFTKLKLTNALKFTTSKILELALVIKIILNDI